MEDLQMFGRVIGTEKEEQFLKERLVVYNKENLERQETNKYGRGTEQQLPKTEECRPARR